MYAVKNRYYKHSKLDEQVFREILQLFAMDLTAVQCARLTGVNVRSVNSIFLKLRERIADWSQLQARNTAGLRGHSMSFAAEGNSYLQSEADGVVGINLHLRGDQVFCAALESANDDSMSPAHLDDAHWRAYPVGVDLRRDMQLQLKSVTLQRAENCGDRERIEAFGRFLRLRLTKFKGLRRGKFVFHLKESEFRFNHRRSELYPLLLNILGESPIE